MNNTDDSRSAKLRAALRENLKRRKVVVAGENAGQAAVFRRLDPLAPKLGRMKKPGKKPADTD